MRKTALAKSSDAAPDKSDGSIVEHYPTDEEWRREKRFMAALAILGLIYLIYWLVT